MLSWIKKLLNKKEEIPSEMKYLVVGLGNMHPDYDDTRHNVGFEVVDMIAYGFDAKFKHANLGDLAEIKHKGRTIYLLKPSTYMNRSGKAVKYWMDKHKILRENLLVVVDDLNLDFEKLRLRGKGSDGGHNGLKDIQATFGDNKYARLRVGIGDNFSKGRQVDFVLGKWSKEEDKKLGDILIRTKDIVLNYCTIGLKFTMDKVKN